VAKYEDKTPRTKKVMIQVQVCRQQWQRRQDYKNTSTLFFLKSQAKNECFNQITNAKLRSLVFSLG
jgi:hypothetical protein